jgi:S-adenosylmethionine:tRNA-ribosyltransferase-isomerase (queuine synthetase)
MFHEYGFLRSRCMSNYLANITSLHLPHSHLATTLAMVCVLMTTPTLSQLYKCKLRAPGLGSDT